ncbi:MAG: diacylglycerol kinase family lipid kinase [Chloroflexaceae bacterium]|nr:diacylglycerol kinase family lipid kinase [Chloroflexaceae bacterium]
MNIEQQQPQYVFTIINPASGMARPDQIRQMLATHFDQLQWTYEYYETTGQEDIPELVRQAVHRGCTMVVAAGGDGTVGAVASGLVYTQIPLGIVPVGTANVLAQDLDIPLNLDQACALFTSNYRIMCIDAMHINDHFFFTQVGIGLDALMIRNTGRTAKRFFGRVAYIWSGLRALMGFQPQRFTIVTDTYSTRQRALQVIVANSGLLGAKPFQYGPDIHLDSQHVVVCLVKAHTIYDYMNVAWHTLRQDHESSRNIRYFKVQHHIDIHSRRPLPVQADGELIQETPVHIRVVPAAVRVIVPSSPA